MIWSFKRVTPTISLLIHSHSSSPSSVCADEVTFPFLNLLPFLYVEIFTWILKEGFEPIEHPTQSQSAANHAELLVPAVSHFHIWGHYEKKKKRIAVTICFCPNDKLKKKNNGEGFSLEEHQVCLGLRLSDTQQPGSSSLCYWCRLLCLIKNTHPGDCGLQGQQSGPLNWPPL